MPEALAPHAVARPEGGAVRLSFGLSSDARTVRVLRVTQGDPTPAPGDNVHVVFDGDPPQATADYRFHRAAPEQPRYEAWDLEAFTEHFADAPNEIDDATWDYHVYAFDEGGTPGEPASITVPVARALSTRFTVNVKELAYQRARYHARTIGNLFVAKLENLHNKPPPQLLIKARYQLLNTHIGELHLDDGMQVSATFRGIVEALLVTLTPDQRDDIGDQLAPRLLSDLHLLGELGWEGVQLAYQDGLATFGDIPHYTRTFTLDGLVDAHIVREHAPPLHGLTAEWAVPVD